MRYRALNQDDMSFGHGQADFLIDSRAAVAQAIMTRLRLLTGEWFLDLTEGTAWNARVLGFGTGSTYDPTLKERILGTSGVTGITRYFSELTDRRLSVEVSVDTRFGEAALSIRGIGVPISPGGDLGIFVLDESRLGEALLG